MNEPTKVKVNTEQLAYWYFRLNGFLTTVNFVVHHDYERRQRTDADILGVRFPFRKELLVAPLIDEAIFTQVNDKPFIIIAEVKTGECKLNGPWTEPERENVQRVLRAIGAFSEPHIDEIAKAIYSFGVWENENYFLSLVCVGKEESRKIKTQYPQVLQIVWADILEFIYKRFTDYRRQKADHQQWDSTGKLLFNQAKKFRDPNAFIESIELSNE